MISTLLGKAAHLLHLNLNSRGPSILLGPTLLCKLWKNFGNFFDSLDFFIIILPAQLHCMKTHSLLEEILLLFNCN